MRRTDDHPTWDEVFDFLNNLANTRAVIEQLLGADWLISEIKEPGEDGMFDVGELDTLATALNVLDRLDTRIRTRWAALD
jgi:hypothetical protein